jgi:hypothetical protein
MHGFAFLSHMPASDDAEVGSENVGIKRYSYWILIQGTHRVSVLRANQILSPRVSTFFNYTVSLIVPNLYTCLLSRKANDSSMQKKTTDP